MPFYDGINPEQRVSLTLSHETEAVLEYDMQTFGEKTLAGIINKVFANFRSYAQSSISLALSRKNAELNELLRYALKGMEPASRDKIEKELRKAAKNFAEDAAKQYRGKKGSTIKIRLNNSNVSYLEGDPYCRENIYYGSISEYIRAVLEEYAEKSHLEREAIFFHDTLEKISAALYSEDQKKTPWQLTASLGDQRRIMVVPYRVVPDPLFTYRYLVSLDVSGELDANGEPRRLSHRISRLRNVEIHQILDGLPRSVKTILKDEKAWRAELNKRGPQFMSYAPTDVKLMLTGAGERMYQEQLHLRPKYIGEPTDGIYNFHCTPQQIEFYFFKFGKHVRILEPLSLAELFAKKYKEAASKYDTGGTDCGDD